MGSLAEMSNRSFHSGGTGLGFEKSDDVLRVITRRDWFGLKPNHVWIVERPVLFRWLFRVQPLPGSLQKGHGRHVALKDNQREVRIDLVRERHFVGGLLIPAL